MKENKRLQRRWKAARGLFVLLTVLLIGFSAECFTIVSHAESEGKITANSAKIRKEPSTNSTSLGSALKDTKVSIKGQTTGADGKIWYQVYVDADTLGYIRSDLVEITDGSVPGTVGTGGTTTPANPGQDEQVVVVNEVVPVSASVTGGQAVRVRQNASTTSRIVTTAQSGLVLNVTGTAVGTDGNNWYQVNYLSNGSEVSGFIRSEYVELSGELVPVTADPPVVQDPPVESTEPTEPAPTEVKDWDTYYGDGVWHLVNNGTNESYNIENIFSIAAENKQTALDALAAKKKQQVVIIVLVILLIGLAALVTYLIFRVKDMMDSAYFKEVERETARRRADRPQNGQKVMHTVGEERKASGQRPAGGSANGQRPAGQRPSGGNGSGQGQRPAGGSANGQRPAGQRPSGSNGSGQGQRPAGSSGGGQGQRPAGGNGQRPAGQRPEGGASQAKGASQEQGWKSKNFMADDDDFKFLDWDEVEDK